MRGRWLIVLLLLVPFFGTARPVEKACFSVPGGFYENSPVLELFPFYQQHHIRYTTNGNRPTAQSRLYTGPLLLDESFYSTSNIYTIQISPDDLVFVPDSVQHCIVIRAAVFDENDNCISEVATNSYFIKSLGCDTHGLPVMSLCCDSLDLFNYHSGILVPGGYFNPNEPNWTGNYYQHGTLWERTCNWEFYELDNSGVNQQAGLRTHGGNARRGPQKGLKLFAREAYGKSHFQHAFFDIPNESFKHLVLKPFTDQWFSAGIQNMICQQLAKNINVESLAFRPSVLFINGEYWGIYSVCEKPDADYLEDHFGNDEDEYNVIGDWYGTVENGSNANFLQMIQWLEDIEQLDDESYQYLCTLIDVDCFIDYYCLEFFIANDDWPANNVRCYQHLDGKWRWIFFDGDNALQDMGFDVMENATSTLNTGWPNNLASTLLFRKLITNNLFMSQFLSRFRQLMENQFSYDQTKPYFDTLSSLVKEEIPAQSIRFQRPENLSQWEDLIAKINDFLRFRVIGMNEMLNDFLSEDDYGQASSFYCAPNPFTNTLALVLDSETTSNSQLEVYDTMGRMVYCKKVSLTAGTNIIKLELSLAPGLYYLKNGESAMKIIRQ